MKCIDLFGGIGGFRYGLSMAGEDFTFTYYADNDPFACAVYNYRFDETWEPIDIRSVQAGDVPDHKILCAGPPCPSFSKAGLKRGFDDPRGQLFFEIGRIARVKQPEYLFLENVAGLLYHNRGRTFARIIDTLRDCGYVGSWCCIDSAAFVPQSRNRVYIVARLGDEPSRALLPFANRDREAHPIRDEVTETAHRFWRYPAYTLQSRDYKGGAMQYLLEPTDPDWWSEDRDPTQSPSGEWWLLPEPECKGIIVNSGGEYNVRRLTPLECERLQGFPDNWTSRGTFPDGERDMSMSRRYRLLGNAVTAPVVTAIGMEIAKEMKV